MLSFFSPPRRPANERDRQEAVDISGVLHAAPDPAFHAIVAEAARLFDAPMAAVSIVDRERQWFAARIGLAPPETTRAVSFCAHAILAPGELLVVNDAATDERFAGNPLVQFAPTIRFYAGAPIVGRDGLPLGALCAIDDRPRHGRQPLDALAALAHRAGIAIAEMSGG